jgi:hypothetical protein
VQPLKPTSEIGFEQMDTIVNDLLEQVQEMRATLLSAKTSLEALASSNVKHQVQATPLTLVGGRKKHRLKQRIMRKQGVSTVTPSSQRYLSKLEESQ